MTADPRSLSQLAADVHDMLSALSDVLLSAGARPAALEDLHTLIGQMRSITETLALSGLGRSPAGGEAHDGQPQSLDDLVLDLNTDLTKLGIAMHSAGLTDPVATQQLKARIDDMVGVARALHEAPRIGGLSAAPITRSRPRPSTTTPSSALPGERNDSMSIATRLLASKMAKR